VETLPPPLDSKGRRGGLIVFGILTVLLGCLCTLLVPAMFFSQAMAAKNGAPLNGSAVVRASVMYGLVAIAFVWLGIGSVMARRWARALLVILSWTWLAIGVVSVCAMAFMVPRFMATMRATTPPGQPEPPQEALWAGLSIVTVMMGVIFVVFPFGWVLFYGSKNVQATCEACDPKVRWTDRCPLPVLAASLWLAVCVPGMLFTVFVRRGVTAFFGTFVTGSLGTVAYIVLALTWGYCAWAFYKLERRGWWILVTALVLLSISSAITYSRHDSSELFALMGYPHQQVARMRKLAFFKGQTAAWIAPAAMAPMLGYLIYLRRFFPFRTKVK
jgi:hypothetical protein